MTNCKEGLKDVTYKTNNIGYYTVATMCTQHIVSLGLPGSWGSLQGASVQGATRFTGTRRALFRARPNMSPDAPPGCGRTHRATATCPGHAPDNAHDLAMTSHHVRQVGVQGRQFSLPAHKRAAAACLPLHPQGRHHQMVCHTVGHQQRSLPGH